jgi:hypothetical protein
LDANLRSFRGRRTRAVHRAAWLVVSAAVWVLPAVAQAQDEPQARAADIAAARELGIEGVKLADAGDCAAALDRLARAEQLRHAPTTLERLGECQVKLGRLVDGTEALRRVLREVLAPNAPAAFLAAQERANRILADAKPKIAQLKIAITAPPNADFVVRVDGAIVPTANLNANRPIDPGPHVVEASGPRLLAMKTKVTLPEGGSDSVALALQLDPNAPPLVEPAPAAPVILPPVPGGLPPPPPPPPPAHASRVPAYVTLGVGAAGVVVGAITGALAIGDKSSLSSACGPSKVCGPSEESALSSAKTMATVSTVAFIVGGVGLAAGGTLFFTNNFNDWGRGGGSATTDRTRRAAGGYIQTYLTATGGGLRGEF